MQEFKLSPKWIEEQGQIEYCSFCDSETCLFCEGCDICGTCLCDKEFD